MQMIHMLQLNGPATPGRLAMWTGLSSDVESETRRLLATLPSGDLEAVIRFFEVLREVRTGRDA